MSLNALCVRLLESGLGRRAGAPTAVAPGVDPGLLEAVAHGWSGEFVGIALFGSAARGDATEASDIDLLIVLDEAARIERSLYDRWDRIVRARGCRIDERASPQFAALPASAEEAGGLWLEVAREGIILIDRDGRLARFLVALRDLMAAAAVSRKKVHGHPYWIGGRGDSVRNPAPRRVGSGRRSDSSLHRGQSSIDSASQRLKAVDVLFAERGWADVVRESQELVELALKGLLRHCDVEPPRVHDVSDVLRENSTRLPKPALAALDELCEISRRLRRDRELSFYGSEDLTPSTFYREADAREARRQARRVVEVVSKAVSISRGID